MRLLSNVLALKLFKLLMTTGLNGLDGLKHLPLESRSWSGLRLKPDHRDHQQRWSTTPQRASRLRAKAVQQQI